MGAILQDPHAEALLSSLRSIPYLSSTLPVGDAIAPRAANNGPTLPSYSVLYMLPGGTLVSSIGCLDADGWLRFQTTSVAQAAAGARKIDDLIRGHLRDNPPTVPGRFTRVRPDFASSRVERDTSVTPALFYVPTTYRLLSNRA